MTLVEDAPAAVDDAGAPVLELLEEREAYLAAILMDRSGVDLAEFLFVDDTKPDGCFRLHPYQWPWWRSEHSHEVDQGARDIGKSERIGARAIAFPFNYAQQEHAIVAPESSHLDKLTDRIEMRILQSWFLLQMVVHGRGGINHRPWKVRWRNGARSYTIVPQKSGLGAKGVHAAVLDVDEAQDLTEQVWAELQSTVRWEVPGARWSCHGVPKGIVDHFYNITQEGSGFYVHRVTKMHKPSWSKAQREQSIIDFGGSIEAPDYKRNVYGEHGDSQNRIFVLTALMAAVDTRDESQYILHEYFKRTITGDAIAARVGSKAAVEASTDVATAAMLQMIDLPKTHERFHTFWMGMDVGLVGDPSEILVFAEYLPKAKERAEHRRIGIAVPEDGDSRFKLLTRLQLFRIPEPLQVELLMWLIETYKPKAFAMDGTGIGLPLFQALQHKAGTSRIITFEPPQDASAEEKAKWMQAKSKAKGALTVIKNYKFGEKILIDFDEAKVAEIGPRATLEQMIEKAGIKQNAKDRATDVLRTIVDHRRMLLPFDPEVTNQFNGQTYKYSSEPVDAYGKRRMVYSAGTWHVFDAARMFALAWSQEKIEQITAAPAPRKPVYDRFLQV